MKIGGNHRDPRAIAKGSFGRRVEKPSASEQLADDTLRQTVLPEGFTERRRSRRPSRFETRLLPGPEQSGASPCFVAQVLGQILDAGRNSPVAAARVYARMSREQQQVRVVSVL